MDKNQILNRLNIIINDCDKRSQYKTEEDIYKQYPPDFEFNDIVDIYNSAADCQRLIIKQKLIKLKEDMLL